MKALVVYESMFGNTRLIAEAVAGGLTHWFEAEAVEVGDCPDIVAYLDLVVVGGPTHAFGMTRPATRQSAADQTEEALVSPGIGIREWLTRLTPPASQVSAAAFDTRVDKPRVPGSAAVGAHKKLRRLGFHMPVAAQSFYVDGTTGPLLEGEYERAHRWGEDLGSLLARRGAQV
jgi:hypothetical protein